MSDAYRKDLSTKAKETLIPDAMKSDTQKAKEATTDIADRATREAQTDTSKSVTQDAFDKSQRAKDNTKHGSTNESVGDKVKHALGVEPKGQ